MSWTEVEESEDPHGLDGALEMQGQFQEGQVDQFYPIDAIGRWKLLAGRIYKVSPLFQNVQERAVEAGRAEGARTRGRRPPRPADFKLQVIIIGSRGVGKTSLMERFTDDTFCEACKSTVGVDFKIKTVELRGKKIRLQIWDTAGQERFNSITSAYYRSAKGIILVYDITKKETFDDLPKWMKMIDKYASEDAELLLVGNKLDCETDREISRQQGEKFAQQITGMRFCEASAKDNFNVDEIFLKLVDDILKKMPLDMLRNELSNSILSLQPEPEIPPELPPPRPHVRCC
ncbi:ras-related protein Rab-12 [Neophocaena asiaeorientalis asiaeorientalis]|uniref:Ras-related protein Rab-12 n=1 Tax=Neophocaena asiaeorientalis asiaeorientalis TaxID=1706337 RepID=A0A341CXH2_NEOAA|nr:ras-related protein Rab-12 [Neophocaena asiaeorientalis asiaeorientalis]